MMETVKTIIKEQEKIDILINNAGYGSFGALEDVSITEGKHQFEVNLFGMARMIQLVLPQMRKQKSGRIINISSVAGKIYEPCGSWYHSTKFAVEGLSDCLRLEVKEFGIKIIMIEPGPTKSKWNEVARENLIKVSGKTDYKNVIEKSFRLLKNMERTASPASSVVSQIEKAINSRNPKARYVSGKGIKMIILLRRILSDKVFDWLTEMAMK
jgi:short-subunit dehydrogenase